ncbi:Bug family tripartite tricarboxylate transporter substrate binding protein [Georgenia sp. Z1491]|uniref:Bug family tripartite tricarboxylate transporter substrate binding protein n=1 Tax=Georgenia sp. Z1491 TaxID=3416707 RepID=UPI003CF18095
MTRNLRGITMPASIGALALVLAACSGGDADSGETSDGEWSPEQDVSFIVPANAGGGQDIFARSMADSFSQTDDDVTVVVENRPGGSSATGSSYVQQQEGDPHFLLTATISTLSLPITTDVSYTWESFTPIAMVGTDVSIAVVRADSGWDSLEGVIDDSSEVRAGVAGQDGPDSVTLDVLIGETGSEFDRVVFQSGAEIVTAILAGNIEMAVVNPNEVAGQLESGDLVAVAVFADERYPEDSALGDIPTAVEQGYDVSVSQLRGVLAPAGITEEQRAYWEDMVEAYTESEAYDSYIESSLLQPEFLTGDEFESYLGEQVELLEGVLAE